MSIPHVLITGATSGIGAATALSIARRGAGLHIVGRRADALAATETRLIAAGAASVTSHTLDLADPSEFEKLVRVPDKIPPLRAVVLAAGALVAPRTVTAAGVEANYAINHLSKYVLLNAWVEQWAAAGTRVVVGGPAGAVKPMSAQPAGPEPWALMAAVNGSQYPNDAMVAGLAREHAAAGLSIVAWNPGPTRGTSLAGGLSMPMRVAFRMATARGRTLPDVGEQGATLALDALKPGAHWVRGTHALAEAPHQHTGVAFDSLRRANEEALART